VSLLTQGPLVLVVHPATGLTSVKDVIAKARADVAAAQAVVGQKEAGGSALGMDAAMGALRSAEARLNSLEQSYGGLIPNLPVAPVAPGPTGSNPADFYR
jgi:hypothetical protein